MALALGATRPASAMLPLAALAGIVALLLPNFAEPRVLLTLDDFGAVGDGIADDTQAFVDAWNAACAPNDHTILNVPAGKSYQVWPVTFTGPCRDEIKLFISGNTIAPEDPDEWQGSDRDKWLHFYRVEDRSVSGGGFIDGRGQQWWTRSCKGKHHENKKQHCTNLLPRRFTFEGCHGIRVQVITLQNAQQSTLTFTRSSNVRANYLSVTSPEHSPKTNGIHLIDSYNVRIIENLISTDPRLGAVTYSGEVTRLSAVSHGAELRGPRMCGGRRGGDMAGTSAPWILAKLLRWHSEERKNDEMQKHLVDSAQWRNIDRSFADFGAKPRNIRFGLSTDGMNPFNSISS